MASTLSAIALLVVDIKDYLSHVVPGEASPSLSLPLERVRQLSLPLPPSSPATPVYLSTLIDKCFARLDTLDDLNAADRERRRGLVEELKRAETKAEEWRLSLPQVPPREFQAASKPGSAAIPVDKAAQPKAVSSAPAPAVPQAARGGGKAPPASSGGGGRGAPSSSFFPVDSLVVVSILVAVLAWAIFLKSDQRGQRVNM
jgi:hypothetical protein